jgi:carbon-monoxide dehydrogenase medium subunit
VRPPTLADAVELLSGGDPDVKILAGGQSLVPMLNLRLLRPAVLVDLNGVPGLDGIAPDAAGGLTIGALVRHADLMVAPLVIERAPLLAEAARHVGHAAIRHRGTLGGSLAHADPAAELPAALVALDARFVLEGGNGRRNVSAADFFQGPLTTALRPTKSSSRRMFRHKGELGIREIERRSGDFAVAGVIAHLRRSPASAVRCDFARLVGFGVGDRPVRFPARPRISHERRSRAFHRPRRRGRDL